MPATLKGVIHGKTIDLDADPGLLDGEHVSVIVAPVGAAKDATPPAAPGEGMRRAFGAWAEDGEELDRFLAWNREQRKLPRRESIS